MTTLRNIVIILILLACTVRIHRVVSAREAKSVDDTTHVILPVRYLRALSLGFDEVVADVLWLRFVQSIPNAPPPAAERIWLSNQVKSIVELDPAFTAVYERGTSILAVMVVAPQAAREVAERGIERTPGTWRMPFLAGYVCFYELRDMACGADYMRLVTTIPGHPIWVRPLAARLTTASGQYDASIEFLARWIEATPHESGKKYMRERLRQAILARDVDALSTAVDAYREREGATPAKIEDLVSAGILRGIPAEPFGGYYFLREDGSVGWTSQGKPLSPFLAPEDYPEHPSLHP